MQNFPNKIIVHHDGVSRAGPSFAIVNDFHKGRDFPLSSLGFYVGYTYWVERDGTAIRARSDDEEQAHTVGQNFSSIGIGLAGNFDAEDPTDQQVAALGVLLSGYCTKYRLQATDIYPHRHFAQKTCYGMRLDDHWASVVFLRHKIAELQSILDILMRARMGA